MKLTASLVVRNELGRYLAACIDHLRTYCDQIVVLDDGSDDGTREWLLEQADSQVIFYPQGHSLFFKDEGRTRQRLLELTLAHDPEAVLSIDADEFVSDPVALKTRLSFGSSSRVWSLEMEEVWNATPDALEVREDGGWRSHPVPFLWRAPVGDPSRMWAIMRRRLACGRVPMAVMRERSRASSSGVSLLHFGWADPADRVRRHRRYAEADGGRYHARSHLDSILWPDAKVELRERDWPEALLPYRGALVPASRLAA